MIVYSIGEICDRLSILYLKTQFLDNFHEEYNLFKKSFDEFEKKLTSDGQNNLNILYDELLSINKDIWNLESAIRKHEQLSLEEVGKRAIQIRDFNEKRISCKNQINLQFNQGFLEEKSTQEFNIN